MSAPAREAAAGLLEDLANEFVEEGNEAQEETPASGPEEVVAEEVQHETTETEEVPEDVIALISEPDFEQEAEAEVEAEASTEEEQTFDEYEAPELAEERKRRIAAEKKTAWLEEQRVRENRGKWAAEAKKYWRYAEIDSIQATSRRGFLKQAAEQHEAIKGRVDAAIAEERIRLLAEVEAEKERVKQGQAKAWGAPLAGPGGPPPSADERVERTRASNAGRGLRDTIRARLDSGAVDLGLLPRGGETE